MKTRLLSMKDRLTRDHYIPFILAFFYLVFVSFTMGIRTEHVLTISFVLACYYLHAKSRLFAKDFSPLLLFGILYDNLRLIPKRWAGTIHVELPYRIEKALFGIHVGGQKITLCDYFKDHTHWILDLYAGASYSLHLAIPILFAFFLWIKDRSIARLYILAFFLMNMFAFFTYITFPAAPPWYLHQYGTLPPTWETPPGLAGLEAFDRILDIRHFHDMYSKSSWVFGAIPSMHAAFPFMVAIISFFYLRAFFPFAALITLSVWFAAVYLRHHYVIDLLAGVLYALLALGIVWRLKPKKVVTSHE